MMHSYFVMGKNAVQANLVIRDSKHIIAGLPLMKASPVPQCE